MIEDIAGLDQIWVPVGGGGLAAGTALACESAQPAPRLIAAEPAGADDAYRSLREGRLVPQTNPQTIADGLRTSLGVTNFAILQRHHADVALASEAGILEAMRLVWTRLKLVVEPSAVVPLAALLENPALRSGNRLGVILTGGNVDLAATLALLQG